jgi:hypothetical protein
MISSSPGSILSKGAQGKRGSVSALLQPLSGRHIVMGRAFFLWFSIAKAQK